MAPLNSWTIGTIGTRSPEVICDPAGGLAPTANGLGIAAQKVDFGKLDPTVAQQMPKLVWTPQTPVGNVFPMKGSLVDALGNGWPFQQPIDIFLAEMLIGTDTAFNVSKRAKITGVVGATILNGPSTFGLTFQGSTWTVGGAAATYPADGTAYSILQLLTAADGTFTINVTRLETRQAFHNYLYARPFFGSRPCDYSTPGDVYMQP